MTPYYHAGLSQPSLFFKKTLFIFARPRPLNRFVLGCHMIVTRSYVRKLEFCNLIGAFTFQYAAILLDQAEEVRQGQRLRNTHVTTRTYYACIVYVRRYARHVNYPRVTIRQPNFTGQFLALLTGYAKTVLSHD